MIIPENITDGANDFKTNYLAETAEEPVDKLVFSHSAEKNSSGFRFSVLNYFVKSALFLKLLAGVAGDFKEQLSRKKLTKEYMDALIIFASWLLAQSWYFVWDFYHLTNKIAMSKDYKLFVALHEMHFYSKVIWTVAKEKGLLGATAQHALIVPEKLWYFPEEAEVKADCPLPDIFFVYSDEIGAALEPFYPHTRFLKCCSPRFKSWKSSLNISVNHSSQNNKRTIIFVSNAAIVHDSVVLKALFKLLRQGLNNSIILRLRLHPYERLKPTDYLWVLAAAALHKIEISSLPLQEDFKEADLVVGACSTVIYEALLTGVPVMGVFDDYHIRSSIIPNAFTCHINNLSLSSLERYMNKAADNEMVCRFKENIGAFSPDLTTKLIYDACNRG
ncbi:MAG: hypothetical protein HY035_10710 [Nitrospirae bacterium]|nr:hypothetical protein [Nitrospirota bacterium]